MRRFWRTINDWTIPWYAWLVIAVLVLQAIVAIDQAGRIRLEYTSAGDAVGAVAVFALMIWAVVKLAKRGRRNT